MKKVLIMIPAYNEEANIEKVVDDLIRNYPQYDYVVINDCSTDRTAEILEKRGFNYISLAANLGIGGAVQSGYLYAVENDYDIAVQLDGDGQHDPAFIAALIEPISNGGADIVIGSRFIEKNGFQSSAARRAGIRMIRAIIRLCCGVRVTDPTSGFRACGKKAAEFFSENYSNDYPEPEAVVSSALAGFRTAEIPVVMRERGGGASSINVIRSVYYMIKVSLALLICRIGQKRRV